MLLSDIFVAGIAGLPAQARVRLSTGVNGVTPAPIELEKLLDALFYAQGDGPFAGREVRVGCVMFDEANVAYRLMRDLGKGTAQLARAVDGQYVPASDSNADIASILRDTLKLPSRDAFTALFALGPDDLPSRQPKSVAGIDRATLQAELEQLRATRPPDSSEKEFELDGLQRKKFALDDLLRKRSQLTDKLAQAELALSRSRALEELPNGFADLVNNHDRVHAKYKAERDQLLLELSAMEERGEPAAAKVLTRDPLFIGGLVGGLLLLVGATFLEGDARLLGLVDIAPFGLAAVQALTFVDSVEASEKYRARRQRLADRLKKIEAKLERDTLAVRDAMQRMDVESPQALLAQVSQRQAMQAERDRLKALVEAFDAGEGQALASGDAAAIEARMTQLEDELASQSLGSGGSENTRRISEVEALLGVANADEPTPFSTLLQALHELTGEGLDALATTLATKTSSMAQQALGLAGALTLDELGRAAWQGRAWQTLAMPLQDNVFVAGHLAAFGMIAGLVKFPLFLLGLDALPHVLPYAQALPLLEGLGQVVLAANDAGALLGCPTTTAFS